MPPRLARGWLKFLRAGTLDSNRRGIAPHHAPRATSRGGQSQQPDRHAGPLDELLQIACHAPEAAVLIDEAYVEFCGQTLLMRWRETPNLFVARTFSKAYGMAGLRIGVLLGDPEQIRLVRLVSSPYNVNGLALACLPTHSRIRNLSGSM